MPTGLRRRLLLERDVIASRGELETLVRASAPVAILVSARKGHSTLPWRPARLSSRRRSEVRILSGTPSLCKRENFCTRLCKPVMRELLQDGRRAFKPYGVVINRDSVEDRDGLGP
jgi:hypothetical protein